MSNPRSNIFLDRYKELFGEEAYFFIPNGFLEIGNVLGPEAAQDVLQGCLPVLRLTNLDGDFAHAISSMERGTLRQEDIPSLEQVTEPSTCTLAVSYRHCVLGSKALPRQRMIDSQKQTLLTTIRSIAAEKKYTHAVLWFDQAMGQRFPRSERDWIRHGILPYFAFDVVILREYHDLRRCWLYLEELIANSYANIVTVANHAHLFVKTYDYGTIPSIQELAAEVYSGPLRDKDAHDPDDIEQIRRWAAAVLRQRQPLKQLVLGSSWQSRVYNIKDLLTIIRNHQLDSSGEATWRDLSYLNMSRRWHGLSELIGVPDAGTIAEPPEKVRECLVNLGSRCMFNVFAASSSRDVRVQAVAIGCFKCFARPTRVIICLLDGAMNKEVTHVLSSCIIDADDEAGTDEDERVVAFRRVFEQLYKGNLQTSDRNASELDSVSSEAEEREAVALKTSAELATDIMRWPRLKNALEQRDVHFLGEFLESIQAGSVQWG